MSKKSNDPHSGTRAAAKATLEAIAESIDTALTTAASITGLAPVGMSQRT